MNKHQALTEVLLKCEAATIEGKHILYMDCVTPKGP